jgi:hypothetical protein
MRTPGSCLHQRETFNFSVLVGERRLLEPSELQPQEQQLCDKAAEGGYWICAGAVRAQVLFQLLTGQAEAGRSGSGGAPARGPGRGQAEPGRLESCAAHSNVGMLIDEIDCDRQASSGFDPSSALVYRRVSPQLNAHPTRLCRRSARPDGPTRPSRARSHMHRERGVTHQLLRLISGLLSRVNSRPLPRDSRPAREGPCQLLLRRLRMLRTGA